jgi:hypothetical protein
MPSRPPPRGAYGGVLGIALLTNCFGILGWLDLFRSGRCHVDGLAQFNKVRLGGFSILPAAKNFNEAFLLVADCNRDACAQGVMDVRQTKLEKGMEIFSAIGQGTCQLRAGLIPLWSL